MITIYNEDCIKGLAKLPPNSIDCCITSPPYNIGLKYNTYTDKRSDYLDWMEKVFTEVERVLTPNGHFFLNIGPTREDPLLPYNLVQRSKMQIQNSIIWAKAVEIDNSIRGHVSVPKTERYLTRGWEMVWHLTKDGKQPVSLRVPYAPEWLDYNFKKTGRKDRPTTDCWHIPYETTGSWGKASKALKGDKKHPAVFPADLVAHCIDMCGAKSVLDPFGGTGTVAVVAKQKNIDCTLFELDADYCKFIEERLA